MTYSKPNIAETESSLTLVKGNVKQDNNCRDSGTGLGGNSSTGAYEVDE